MKKHDPSYPTKAESRDKKKGPGRVLSFFTERLIKPAGDDQTQVLPDPAPVASA